MCSYIALGLRLKVFINPMNRPITPFLVLDSALVIIFARECHTRLAVITTSKMKDFVHLFTSWISRKPIQAAFYPIFAPVKCIDLGSIISFVCFVICFANIRVSSTGYLAICILFYCVIRALTPVPSGRSHLLLSFCICALELCQISRYRFSL